MDENGIATEVIGSAIEIHRALGPGLLESAYHDCLVHELQLRKICIEREVPLAVEYKGLVIDHTRIGPIFWSAARCWWSFKVVERVESVHKAQLLTYLRLSRRKLGLLINFNVPVLRDGIHRIANKL